MNNHLRQTIAIESTKLRIWMLYTEICLLDFIPFLTIATFMTHLSKTNLSFWTIIILSLSLFFIWHKRSQKTYWQSPKKNLKNTVLHWWVLFGTCLQFKYTYKVVCWPFYYLRKVFPISFLSLKVNAGFLYSISW